MSPDFLNFRLWRRECRWFNHFIESFATAGNIQILKERIHAELWFERRPDISVTTTVESDFLVTDYWQTHDWHEWTFSSGDGTWPIFQEPCNLFILFGLPCVLCVSNFKCNKIAYNFKIELDCHLFRYCHLILSIVIAALLVVSKGKCYWGVA